MKPKILSDFSNFSIGCRAMEPEPQDLSAEELEAQVELTWTFWSEAKLPQKTGDEKVALYFGSLYMYKLYKHMIFVFVHIMYELFRSTCIQRYIYVHWLDILYEGFHMMCAHTHAHLERTFSILYLCLYHMCACVLSLPPYLTYKHPNLLQYLSIACFIYVRMPVEIPCRFVFSIPNLRCKKPKGS